jgi:hypothetical protein
MIKMEVCIIGGGYSGIISCKVALSQNLHPTILDKSSNLGGLWKNKSKDAGIWDSLHLNGSKHLAGYSDHLWPLSDAAFPKGDRFTAYLDSYILKHDLSRYFQGSSEVVSVEFANPGYQVFWRTGLETFSKHFPFVIIATGRFQQPPSSKRFPGSSQFKGLILHSSEYRNPSLFKDKKVVCIGKGVSGSEISLEASKTSEQVTQIWRSKMIIIPKTVKNAPYDYIFNTVSNFSSFRNFINFPDTVPGNQAKLMKTVGNPGELLKDWHISDEELAEKGQHGQHSCSLEYVDAVKKGKIRCFQGDVERFNENAVVLKNGKIVLADVVVLCTGYCVNLEFLSQGIKNVLKYQRENRLCPFLAYRRVLHPDLPGLGFVGFVFGGAGRFELQAEIVVRVFSGVLNLSIHHQWQGINQEQWIRENLSKFYSDYDPLGYLKECLRILKHNPNLDYIKGTLGLSSGPFVPYFLFTDRKGQSKICENFTKDFKSSTAKL